MNYKKILINALQEKALEFGDFTLKSGKKSDFYLDVRKLSLSGHLVAIVDELENALQATVFDAIGGPCVGADPIVGGYLVGTDPMIGGYLVGTDPMIGGYIPDGHDRVDRKHLRAFLVRKEEKDHGKAGRIIGSICPGDRCAVIEDVTTTGGSLLDAVDEVIKFGCTVVMAITVVDRLQGAEQAFRDRGIPFKALTTINDIMPPK